MISSRRCYWSYFTGEYDTEVFSFTATFVDLWSQRRKKKPLKILTKNDNTLPRPSPIQWTYLPSWFQTGPRDEGCRAETFWYIALWVYGRRYALSSSLTEDPRSTHPLRRTLPIYSPFFSTLHTADSFLYQYASRFNGHIHTSHKKVLDTTVYIYNLVYKHFNQCLNRILWVPNEKRELDVISFAEVIVTRTITMPRRRSLEDSPCNHKDIIWCQIYRKPECKWFLTISIHRVPIISNFLTL